MRDAIRDLQLLMVGMVLGNPSMSEEIECLDFADDAFSNLFIAISNEHFNKDEKQQAIADFVHEQFGIYLDPKHRDKWRNALLGLLKTNGEYRRLKRKLSELEGCDETKPSGQLTYVKHFRHIARGELSDQGK